MDLSNVNADSFLAALGGKHYLLAMAVALVGAVRGLRWLAPKLHDKFGALLNTDRGGAVLSLVMGIAGGMVTSLAAGKPLSLSLILSGILVSATGSGIFNLTSRVVNPSDKAATPSATAGKPPGASGTLPTAVGLILCFIGLGAFFMIPSCNTLSGKAATATGKKCETSMLPAEEQAAEVQVVALLSDPVGWEVGLLTLAAQIGKTQVTCLVQMAVAGVNALIHPPTDGGTALASSSHATYGPNIIVTNGKAWLAKHGGDK